MTHRAESIVTTLVATLTGLTTTGARVYRGRAYPLQDAQYPALLIYLGQDELQADYSQEKYDSLLTVWVEARVKTVASQVDTVLNTIREEVTVALQADYTQGLGYVIDTREGDAAEPELGGDGNQPTGALRMQWQFLYRRSRTNPGA